ncbi:cytochrome c biogenesis protein CcmE [bacterium]|nr:cytochrome c biogenesis protein CcmE [bacterium]
MKPKHIRAIWLGIALIVMGLGAWGMLATFKSQLVFFYSPEDLLKQPSAETTIRIGGLVKPGTLQSEKLESRFIITDGKNDIPTSYTGLLPQLFREGQGVVAQGTWDGKGFHAATILTKHDETYMPPEVAKALKDQGVWRGNAGDAVPHEYLYKK